MSDPEEPIEAGAFEPPGTYYAVELSGDYASIADGQAGLRIVNITNLENLEEVGAFEPEFGIAHDVAISGQYLYVAYLIAGMRVIDVADPENPRQIGIHDTPDVAQADTDEIRKISLNIGNR